MESDTKGVTGLTGRYASALFELADESDVLDRVAEDLRVVVRLIEENNDLDRLLRSPIIPRIEQGAAMEAILEKAGASELTKNFVHSFHAEKSYFSIGDGFRAIRAPSRERNAPECKKPWIWQVVSLFRASLHLSNLA